MKSTLGVRRNNSQYVALRSGGNPFRAQTFPDSAGLCLALKILITDGTCAVGD